MKQSADPKRPAAIEAAAAAWVGRRDAGLSPSGERELQQWLEADPRHQAALEFYESTWSALAKPSRTGARVQFELQLISLARTRRRRRNLATGIAAATILLAAGLVVRTQSDRQPAIQPVPTTVVIKPDRLTLPDGSTVELKSEARISVSYTAGVRRVTLESGEAHFDVRKEPGRPFVVTARGVDVRAVGTAFSVALDEKAVEVLVTNGRVTVDKSSRDAESMPAAAIPLATLEAGNRAVVGMEPSAVPEVSEVPPEELDQRLAWRSTRLEFTRTPLSEAVDLLNRHAPASAPRIVVADAALAEMLVSGVFRPDNTEAFILLITGAFAVKSERSDYTIPLHKGD